MGTLYAKVLRNGSPESEYIGNRLEPRQFGFTSDTQSLVIRGDDGTYHFIKQYDDTTIKNLLEALNGDLSSHIQNLEIHVTNAEKQVWDNKQDTILAGDNIQIGTDGKTISATDTIYDDTDINDRIDEEITARSEAVAELQAQIDVLQGAIIFIGRINLPNNQVTQSALTARAQELGKYPLKHGYCLVDNNNDDWVFSADENEWIDVGYFDVSTATQDNLGVVKGSTEYLKINVDSTGEMFVNGLQNVPANTVFAGSVSGGSSPPTFRQLTLADLPSGLGSATTRPNTVFYLGQLNSNDPSQQALDTFGATKAQELYNNPTLLTGYTVRDALDRDWRYVSEGETIVGGGGETIPAHNEWVSLPIVAGVTFNRIIYNNNLFVAIGTGGYISTSTDGRNWTTRQSGTSVDLWDIVYTHNYYIAVGGSATIVTSQNGTTWTPTQVSGAASSGYSIVFTGIASNGTNIYIVGKERGVLVYGTSPTGSWSVSSSTSLLGSSDQERHIAYGNNRWLVAVRRTTGAQSLLYEVTSTSSATSGATGSSGFIATRGGKPSRIRFINGNFWLVTGGNSVSSIADNGRIYNLGNNPNIDNDYSSNAMIPIVTTSLWDIEAYGNNGVMVFGDNGTSIFTTNNTTWQTIDGRPNTNTDLRSGSLASDNTLVIAGNEVKFTRYFVPEVSIGGGGGEIVVTDGYWYLVGGEEAVTGDIDWNNITNKPTIPTSGNLTEQAAVFGQSTRSGNANTWARSDHYHALPSAPTLSSLGGESAITAGTTDQFWRGDKSWQALNSIVPVYGTSSTSASTAAKTSTITGFVRRTGSIVGISFTYANTASTPTLNVNSTGAANIQYNGAAPASDMLAATTVHIFQFDGTNWQLLNPVVTSSGSSIPTPHNSALVLRSMAVSTVVGYGWDKLNLDLDVKNTLPIANGGTGSTTAAGALANLGGIGDRITTYATSSTNFDNITTSGVYSVYGSSSSSNHSPSTSITGSNAWNLLVIGGNNGVIQIASPAGTSGGTVYYRVGGGSSSTSFPTTWQTLSNGGGGVSVADLSSQGTPIFGQSSSNGVASTAARSDHVHALPAFPIPSPTSGGQLLTSAQVGSAVGVVWATPNFSASAIWSGSNTGGDCNAQTTPGNYSGSWSTNTPTGNPIYGSLLVLASDTSSSYRQQIFIAEGGTQTWFRSSPTRTWIELTNKVNRSGDTMTGILNIERGVFGVSESNRYFQIKSTSTIGGYNTLDGMRIGVGPNNTCGGWIQSFLGNSEGGTIQLNPNGGTVSTGGSVSVKGGLSVTNSVDAQDLYVKGTARFGSVLTTARRVEMTGYDGFALRGATGDARSILMYRGEIYFFMDSNADFDSTAAGFRFALEGTTSAPTLTVKKKAQNGSWTNAAFSNGAFS